MKSVQKATHYPLFISQKRLDSNREAFRSRAQSYHAAFFRECQVLRMRLRAAKELIELEEPGLKGEHAQLTESQICSFSFRSISLPDGSFRGEAALILETLAAREGFLGMREKSFSELSQAVLDDLDLFASHKQLEREDKLAVMLGGVCTGTLAFLSTLAAPAWVQALATGAGFAAGAVSIVKTLRLRIRCGIQNSFSQTAEFFQEKANNERESISRVIGQGLNGLIPRLMENAPRDVATRIAQELDSSALPQRLAENALSHNP